MILKSKETTIAYRCPVCGKNIMSLVGVFALSGDLIKLKCDCGQSALTIARAADQKIRLTVPCLLCPNPHNYTLSTGAFFDGDLIALPCTYSDVDICFIGGKDQVLEALKESDEVLLEMLRGAGFDDYDDYRGRLDAMDDRSEEEDEDDGAARYAIDKSQVEDVVRFMLSELRDDGDIHCGCPDGDGDYEFDMTSNGVCIYCRQCGRSVKVKLNGTTAAMDFLHCDSLTLSEENRPEEPEA